ncbi:MAG: CBS domain-containing protein [Gammaproteobacteria bacterium]
MSTSVVTVPPGMGIMQLVHLLAERNVGGAVVADENGLLMGIVSERDCISVAVHAGYFDEFGGTVSEYMTRNVETCGANENLLDVAQRMAGSAHRLFPVVEDGRLIGVLSRGHVLGALTNSTWFTSDAVGG